MDNVRSVLVSVIAACALTLSGCAGLAAPTGTAPPESSDSVEKPKHKKQHVQKAKKSKDFKRSKNKQASQRPKSARG